MAPLRRLMALWLTALGALALTGSSDFREDQLECEQAVAHLVDCCPGFGERSLQCDYSQGCGTETHTALSIEESHCIEGRSCDELQQSGICQKTQFLPSPTFDVDGGVKTPKVDHPPVCP